MNKYIFYHVYLLSSLLSVCVASQPRISDLILPDPFSNLSGRKEIRPYNEVLGTGIGKYEYTRVQGHPIETLYYYIVDPTFGDATADPRLSASHYIETVINLQIQFNQKEEESFIKTQISGVDCIVADYPNQHQANGYILKQYVVQFHIPEHQRIYAVTFEAFWHKDANVQYDHKLTPIMIRKAVRDFIAYNR